MKSPRILLIEESEPIRNGVYRCLAERYEVREAEPGDAAWQTLMLDTDVRLVILDPVMSRDGDAWEFLKRMRHSRLKRLRELPVLACSAVDDPLVREKSMAEGVQAYCSVDDDFAQLSYSVDRIFDAQAMPVAANDEGNPLEHAASGAWQRGRQAGTDSTLLCLRLDPIVDATATVDRFVRDRIGQALMRQLSSAIRREDVVFPGRDSGEYWVVATGTGTSGAFSFAVRLQAALARSRLGAAVSATCPPVTACFGLVGLEDDQSPDFDDAKRLAQTRVDEAQSQGRGFIIARAERVKATFDVPDDEPCPDLPTALSWIRAGRSHQLLPYLDQIESELKPLLGLLRRL